MKKSKVFIAAGGSGGHLFPALGVAEQLSQENFAVAFCGVGLKNNPFFPKEKYLYQSVCGNTLNRKTFYKAPFQLFFGLLQAIKFLLKQRPDFLIGFGSFHSFPTIAAAWLLRIPFALFEPNTVLGKVNALFYPKATHVFSYFPIGLKREVVISPPRMRVQHDQKRAKENLQLETNKPILLIVGGSQGSMIVNQAVTLIERERLKRYFVIHILGKNDSLTKWEAYYKEQRIEARVLDFSNQMDSILSVTDLCISRAGASTIYEAISFSIPSILIPYGEDPKGHQIHNAKYFVKTLQGGCMLLQNQITKDSINQQFEELEEKREVFRSHLQNCKNSLQSSLVSYFVSKGIKSSL
jgi:UDP-N-acetylglucosamine--N-acetylmuramyl-(pentapeptide) pyrophosphoryl-undecaprenol N-acetylglucosamine transferase